MAFTAFVTDVFRPAHRQLAHRGQQAHRAPLDALEMALWTGPAPGRSPRSAPSEIPVGNPTRDPTVAAWSRGGTIAGLRGVLSLAVVPESSVWRGSASDMCVPGSDPRGSGFPLVYREGERPRNGRTSSSNRQIL